MIEPATTVRLDVDTAGRSDGGVIDESARYRRWGIRVVRGALAGGITLLVVGIPTDIIDTSMFGREVPVRTWEFPVLLATALLTAFWFGVDKPARVERTGTPAALGVALTFFAVGCPVCNKLVLLALGTSGALGLWAPIQPFLAGVSLTMLTAAVIVRWRKRDCTAVTCAT